MARPQPLRNADYTLYMGEHLYIYQVRDQYPGEEVCLILNSEDEKWGDVPGFKKSVHTGDWWKAVAISELDSAYSVRTYGTYKGLEVSVFNYGPDPSLACIFCRSASSMVSHQFQDLANGTHGDDVPFAELGQIWEIREPSQFDLPYPESLEKRVTLP